MKRIRFLGILCTTLLLTMTGAVWNTGSMGFYFHPKTLKVVYLTPELHATGTDLQIGDTLLSMNQRPWSELLADWNFARFMPPPDQPIPMTIERQGAIRQIALYQYPQTPADYRDKVINGLLALTCLLTGYTLAKRAYYEGVVPQSIGFFWYGVGLVVGLHNLAGQVSLPLLATLEWVMLSIYSPYFVVAHTFFPYRSTSAGAMVRSQRRLLYGFVGTNAVIVMVVYSAQMTLVDLVTVLNPLMTSALFLAFVGSTVLLVRAYRTTTVSHVRRQIRIIVGAYSVVMSVWFTLLTLPSVVFRTPIPGQFINLITIIIPITYLISGIFPDLYHVDRLLRRGLSHLLAVSLVVLAARGTLHVLPSHSETLLLWLAVYGIGLYLPLLKVIRRTIPLLRVADSYEPLYEASHGLTTTLDRSQLIAALATGIGRAFQHPALGMYIRTSLDQPHLHRVYTERMPYLPDQVVIEAEQEAQHTTIQTSAHVRTIIGDRSLPQDLHVLVHHPHISVWCPIYHAQYHVLGVIVLGRRDDQDPYRPDDVRELQRLMNAAGLAFAHSAVYEQQVESQRTIRHLFQEVQRIQDETSQAIAREIHDEIINISIRLNIESLQTLIATTHDPAVLQHLELMLMSEQTMAHTLRRLCESLHPSGIDDPYSFAPLLADQIGQLRVLFHGSLQFHSYNAICPIPPTMQHELLRITKEAVMNAIKHANATSISITLRYPQPDNPYIDLMIKDNGSHAPTSKPGHFGIRNMRERALMLDGTCTITHEDGTCVHVLIPFTQIALEQSTSWLEEGLCQNHGSQMQNQ